MSTVTSKNWKNKKGTGERTCVCGSWKNHWIKFAKKDWPEYCSVKECGNAPVLGAHVINAEVEGERIVPMCDSCNKLQESFDLKGEVTVVRANTRETCEK